MFLCIACFFCLLNQDIIICHISYDSSYLVWKLHESEIICSICLQHLSHWFSPSAWLFSLGGVVRGPSVPTLISSTLAVERKTCITDMSDSDGTGGTTWVFVVWDYLARAALALRSKVIYWIDHVYLLTYALFSFQVNKCMLWMH